MRVAKPKITLIYKKIKQNIKMGQPRPPKLTLCLASHTRVNFNGLVHI